MKKISKRKLREFRFQTMIEIVMVLIMFFAFVPIFVMIIMSFKSNWEIYNNFFALPRHIEWDNYRNAF